MLGVRQLFVILVGLVAAALVVAPAPALAGGRPPVPSSVSLAVSSDTAAAGERVQLTGQVLGDQHASRATLQVRTAATDWRALDTSRLDDEGSFAFSAEPVLGPNHYRVVVRPGSTASPGRTVSPERTVSGLLAADPPTAAACCPVTVSGRLPTRGARPVELRVETEQGPQPVVEGSSDRRGRVSVRLTLTAGATVVLHAPETVVHGHQLPSFTSPPLAIPAAEPPPGPSGPTTVQVSEHGGTQPRVSGDGRLVAYTVLVDNGTTGTPVRTSVFVWDRASGQRREISVAPGGGPANGTSDTPAVSADGRFVAFLSTASNLVADDDNRTRDLFLWDARSGSVERVASSATEGGLLASAALSADGRFVAFTSSAPDLVAVDDNGLPDAFLLDRTSGRTTLVSHAADDPERAVGGRVVDVSASGGAVTFVSASSAVADGDTHAGNDVFSFDAAAGTSRLVSRLAAGAELGWPVAASADGSTVGYQEVTGMLVGRALVWDARTGEQEELTDPADPGSSRHLSGITALSADGRYALVEWHTTAGVNDVYRVDRVGDAAVRLNGAEFEGLTGSTAYAGSLSDDARAATFWSIPPGGGRGESFLWVAGG